MVAPYLHSHRAGIRPDIHVETERTKAVPDFLDLIATKSYLEDILLSTDVSILIV